MLPLVLLCYTTAPAPGGRHRDAARVPGHGMVFTRNVTHEQVSLIHTRPQGVSCMHNTPHSPRSCILILIVMLGLLTSLGHAAETFSLASVAVYFSPNGGATDAVVREVSAAKT
jgi:hypothetical protein